MAEKWSKWTQREKNYIIENWTELSDEELAVNLGREIKSVKVMRSTRLGLSRFVPKLVYHTVKYPTIAVKQFQAKLDRMQVLIRICTYTESPAIKDQAKKELRKLSGLK